MYLLRYHKSVSSCLKLIVLLFSILYASHHIAVYAVEASTAEIDFHNESKVFDFHNVFGFYQPNYLLAFYHTNSPDYTMYNKRTPNNQQLSKNEVKVQISAYLPIFRSMFGNENLRLYLAYQQIFFWQLYSRTQFIREVDYEPMLWLRYNFIENMFANLIIEHQSNGKGGYMEVSWNRVIGYLEFTGKNWYIRAEGWVPFAAMKADDHNPSSLPHYLGYDKLILSYNLKNVVLSLEGQNFESGFTRGHIIGSVSYSATSRFKLYFQYFTGYGQSLIEFDSRTSSYGIGVALSDWQ